MRYGLTFMLLLLTTISIVAQPEIKPGLTPEQAAESIAAYAQKLADSDRFSGSILVARDGNVLLSRAWGMANETAKNTTSTKFNIGSINKAFTRMAIEQLAQRGMLSLDDTIRKHLPDYPSPVADRITIRQLLEHRSGLGDIFGAKYDAAPPSKLLELTDFLALFASDPLRFEPGTSKQYSNAGYIVLGLIIERLSGEKYRDYVQKNIFTPAGMKETGFWTLDEDVANRATGYMRRTADGPQAKRTSNRATLPGRPSSAGGAFSTVGDLYRFAQWAKVELGIAGGAPGTNAALESANGWTIVTMSNYDPPAASDLARSARAIIRGNREEAAMQRGGPPATPDEIDLSGPVTVPLTPMEHLFAVDAMVNGKGPYRFTIDSGASGMLRVSPKLAESLGLQKVGEVRAGDPSGANVTMRPVVRVDSIQIGGAQFSGLQASVGGGAGPVQPDGIIGLGLFGELTVTLDYPRQQLRLAMKPLPEKGEHVVPFTLNRGIPTIEVDAAGTKVEAHVDSGSPAFLSVPASTRLSFNGEPRVVGRGRTPHNEFEIKAAELNGEVRVAGHGTPNPTIDILDVFPIANLGSRFLRQYAVTFDLANRRLGLEK